jgi:hypothetical protein
MKNKMPNVIWVDFRTGRKIDISNFGHLEKPARQIPYLCQSKNVAQKVVGRK